MNEQVIGQIAGEVWVWLKRNGGRADVSTVREQVRGSAGLSADVGMGWLAREGKLVFSPERGSVQVALREA